MRPLFIKQKKIFLSSTVILIIIAGIISFSTVFADSESEKTTDKQRPDVLFLDEYHDLHMDSIDCLDCHHVYENGENVLEESELEDGEVETACSSCHNSDATLDLQKAFHQQCMGCHNKMKKEKEKTGPSLCGECHIRESKTQ